MTVTIGLMLQILESVILPVFIVIAVGFSIRRFTSIESHSLSNVILYALTPCLVFSGIAESSLESHVWSEIGLITVGDALIMMILSWSIAKMLGLDQKLMSAFILSTALTNSGNYGLPVNLLAFGERGLETAVIFYVISSVIAYTLGAFIASHGTQGLRQSLASVTRLPLIYAAVAGFAVRLLMLQVPQPVLQSVKLMSGAAIPAMLLVLGMELAEPALLRSKSAHWRLAMLSSIIKLFLPIIPVLLLSQIIGLGGLARNVVLVQACMPTAVVAIIFTVKYKGASQFVTSVIVMSTLASLLTLTLLLSFIM